MEQKTRTNCILKKSILSKCIGKMFITEVLSSHRSVFLSWSASNCIWTSGPSMFLWSDTGNKGNWCEYDIHAAGWTIIIFHVYLRSFCLLPTSMKLWQVNLFGFRKEKKIYIYTYVCIHIYLTCHSSGQYIVSTCCLMWNMLYTEKCVMNMLQLSQSSKLSKDKKKKKERSIN